MRMKGSGDATALAKSVISIPMQDLVLSSSVFPNLMADFSA